jgi:hypothetical protein
MLKETGQETVRRFWAAMRNGEVTGIVTYDLIRTIAVSEKQRRKIVVKLQECGLSRQQLTGRLLEKLVRICDSLT